MIIDALSECKVSLTFRHLLPYPLRVKLKPLKQFALLTMTLFLLSLLAGCAAGPNASTRLINQVTDGVEGEAGAVKVRNFTLVLQEDGSAVVVATIINQDEALDQVTSIFINGEKASIGSENQVSDSLPLSQNTPLIFSGPSANAYAFIDSLALKPGYRAPVEITLAKSGIINLDVLIRDKSGEFAQVSKPEVG